MHSRHVEMHSRYIWDVSGCIQNASRCTKGTPRYALINLSTAFAVFLTPACNKGGDNLHYKYLENSVTLCALSHLFFVEIILIEQIYTSLKPRPWITVFSEGIQGVLELIYGIHKVNFAQNCEVQKDSNYYPRYLQYSFYTFYTYDQGLSFLVATLGIELCIATV